MTETNCILIITRGCPKCTQLLKLLKQRYRTLLRYIPVLYIEDAQRYYPEHYNKAVRYTVDDYGYITKTIHAPTLVCLDREEPETPPVDDEDELMKYMETLMTRLTIMMQRTKQQYRRTLGVGGATREEKEETGEKSEKSRRKRGGRK